MLPMELAKDRHDGLGWYFGLFFLVHAAVPGVAASAAAYEFGGDRQALWLAASALAYLPLLLVVRAALAKKRRIEATARVLAEGVRGTADVLSVERLLGNSKSSGRRFARAASRLLVHLPGEAPYEVETRAWYGVGELSKLVPGALANVAVDPGDRTQVVVIDAGPRPVVGAPGWGPGWAVAPAPVIPFGQAPPRRMLAGVLLMVVIGVVTSAALFVGLSMDDRQQEVAERFFARLRAEDYEAAYDELSEDLRRQLGSPAELGRRWEASRLTVARLAFTCSRGGGGDWRLGFVGKYGSFGDPPHVFRLGTLSSSKCRGTATLDLVDEGGRPKISAVLVDLD